MTAVNDVNKRESDPLITAIVGAAYEVGNVLGAGFLEKVYERGLARECSLRGLRVRTQVPYRVSYKGYGIGDYYADLLVEDRMVVELKCCDCFSGEHIAQCLNYLKASG
jgi:GxxExxY protein